MKYHLIFVLGVNPPVQMSYSTREGRDEAVDWLQGRFGTSSTYILIQDEEVVKPAKKQQKK